MGREGVTCNLGVRPCAEGREHSCPTAWVGVRVSVPTAMHTISLLGPPREVIGSSSSARASSEAGTRFTTSRATALVEVEGSCRTTRFVDVSRKAVYTVRVFMLGSREPNSSRPVNSAPPRFSYLPVH